MLVETTRSLVVLLFVIDPISILAHPHCTTVGKLWKSLVVIHSQKILLKAAWPAFQPCYEHLGLAKRITTVGFLMLTLISENQGLEKLRSVSNLRKISGPAYLDFFSVCHLDFFRFII